MYEPREFHISNGSSIPLDVRIDGPRSDGKLYFLVTQDESIVMTLSAAQDLVLAMMDLEAALTRINEQADRDGR